MSPLPRFSVPLIPDTQELPRLVIFLDQRLDSRRLRVADILGIIVGAGIEGGFEIQNPQVAPAKFQELFSMIKGGCDALEEHGTGWLCN